MDASREKDFNLAAVKAEDLPVEMRQLDAAERQAYVDKHARERADLQARINELNREREKFVARQTKEAAGHEHPRLSDHFRHSRTKRQTEFSL